ncbi:LppP/LprE family lipoprotein [Corynebacterium sp. P5848]|uniref:LppP/LprE family lipoprotein n=1 Tax=Corynebacterium marambiense TaxID=2765364 RepID=UPI002260B14A|nr:LppP/LprE family lipoprotein [Corynebacterium marambiense]MCX7543741.1 LppP/LprE family lipoprotein [Corynebacterium marambiense]
MNQESTSQLPPEEAVGSGITVVDPSSGRSCDSTAQNPLSEVDSLPIVSSGGQQFSFTITEDHFDPCAPLSWAVLAGGVGTGNSQRQGVVFFRAGRTIADPAPLMEEKVIGVTPLGTDSVKVSYGVLDGPRAAGHSLPGSAVFTLTPEGSLLISENTLPSTADEAGLQLDVRNLKL